MTRKDLIAVAAALRAADAHAKGPFTIGYPDKASQDAAQVALLSIRLAIKDYIRQSNVKNGAKTAASFDRLSRYRA